MTNQQQPNNGQDFASLLNEYLPSEKQFSGEEIMRGIVRAITKDFVLVDVGRKSDGVIQASEFTPDELKHLRVGDQV